MEIQRLLVKSVNLVDATLMGPRVVSVTPWAENVHVEKE